MSSDTELSLQNQTHDNTTRRVLSKKSNSKGCISLLHFFEKDQLIWHKTIGIISNKLTVMQKKVFIPYRKSKKIINNNNNTTHNIPKSSHTRFHGAK